MMTQTKMPPMNPGRFSLPIRLLVGLHYLKHACGESDETVVNRWLENPYWQHFCGYSHFQHRFPLHPTALVKWRKRIGESGMEKLLEETIACAKRMGAITRHDVAKVNVDTTMQEKAIAFPLLAPPQKSKPRQLCRPNSAGYYFRCILYWKRFA